MFYFLFFLFFILVGIYFTKIDFFAFSFGFSFNMNELQQIYSPLLMFLLASLETNNDSTVFVFPLDFVLRKRMSFISFNGKICWQFWIYTSKKIKKSLLLHMSQCTHLLKWRFTTPFFVMKFLSLMCILILYWSLFSFSRIFLFDIALLSNSWIEMKSEENRIWNLSFLRLMCCIDFIKIVLCYF